MNIPKIISEMTLQEKIAFCTGADFWHTKKLLRQGVPAVKMSDGPHGLRCQEGEADMIGVNKSLPATCFPAAVMAGATWNRELYAAEGEAIGKEALAAGVSVVLGPGCNIKRNPLGGRNFEYISEDPYFAGKMAAAFVRGQQSTGVASSLKHFAANSQEYKRQNGDSQVDERTLREIYLAAFEIAVKEGHPDTVMCAYNKINGVHCSDSKKLLTDILRTEWGFDGTVVTDWGALNDRIKGFWAGCDLNMPGGSRFMERATMEAVEKGILSEADIDASVERILRLVEKAQQAKAFPVDRDIHHKLAQTIAEQGAVLLKNEGSILPLSSEDMVLIGHMAKEMRYQGTGSSHINPARLVNLTEAILLAAMLVPVTGVLLFTVPEASQTVQVIWVMVSYNLYYSFAFTIYNMSHTLMVPLSTRNTTQRGSLSVFNNIASVMISGMIVAMVFPMVVMPALDASKGLWIMTMSILSIIALPLTLLEYLYTKERVTEEGGENAEAKPLREQLKAVFHDKYWIVIILYYVVYTLGANFKNQSLVYYCNYVLGSYNDGVTQTLVSVIGGIPMGIGIFAVWPLAKKFGKRNVTLWGFVLYAIGGAICCAFPTNMAMVLAGQFIKNIGGLPCAYVFMALFADVLDHIEWKYDFRCDGLSTSVYSIITTICAGIASGVLNLCMARTGYIAPVYDAATKVTTGAVQNAATQGVFIFFFVGFEIITAIILIVLLRFLNVEKTIDKEQAEIKARREK